MIGEPDAGKPHVRFDEGVQETCDIAARLRPTLPEPPFKEMILFRIEKLLTNGGESSSAPDPLVRLSANPIRIPRKADGGVGRGPGGPPHKR
jgi:hypothetical protein